MKKTVAGVICFFVCWSSIFPAYAVSSPRQERGGLHSNSPAAKVIHVSPEEYPTLQADLSRRGYHMAGEQRLLAAGESDWVSQQANVMEDVSQPNECDDGASSAPTAGLDLSLDDFSFNINDKEAVIVFVVIGAVVLVVWASYVVKYLYDVTAGMVSSCGRWSEFSFSASGMSSDTGEYARFNGLRYLTGMRDGNVDFGISAEAGHSDMLLREAGDLKLQGAYWLVGPLLRWRLDGARNPSVFQMEFVMGSTEHREVGLLAHAKAGLSFGLSRALRWGVHLGAMNINLRDNGGIVSDRNRYYSLIGMDIGYRF